MGAAGVSGRASVRSWTFDGRGYIEVFLYLQLLDFMTTLIGMKMGLGEASPLIRYLMEFGPAAGLALSKAVAVVICGICIWLNKRHVVRWINYWYAALVVWNMALISHVLSGG